MPHTVHRARRSDALGGPRTRRTVAVNIEIMRAFVELRRAAVRRASTVRRAERPSVFEDPFQRLELRPQIAAHPACKRPMKDTRQALPSKLHRSTERHRLVNDPPTTVPNRLDRLDLWAPTRVVERIRQESPHEVRWARDLYGLLNPVAGRRLCHAHTRIARNGPVPGTASERCISPKRQSPIHPGLLMLRRQ